MILGVILARGGSKRLPFKNMRLLGGRPLVGWSILAALESAWIDRIVVSSDDLEILGYASTFGAVECLQRPAHLAQDHTSAYDALIHAIGKMGTDCAEVVLLQPTSPLRNAGDIEGCVHLLHGPPGTPEAAVTKETGKETPNGAVYAATVRWIKAGGNWDTPGLPVHWMPPERSVDINTAEDLERAEGLVLAMETKAA